MAFRINIAATRNDWIRLLKEARGEDLLRFYAMTAPERDQLAPMRLEEIQGLGIARFGILVQEASYLALPATEPPIPEEILLNRGGRRHALDQRNNPDSFILRPGGLWKEDCYLIGEISSLHSVGLAFDVSRKIKNALRRTCQSRSIYWVAPECLERYSHCAFTADCRFQTTTTAP
jgi:hypothetical protein